MLTTGMYYAPSLHFRTRRAKKNLRFQIRLVEATEQLPPTLNVDAVHQARVEKPIALSRPPSMAPVRGVLDGATRYVEILLLPLCRPKDNNRTEGGVTS